MKIKNIFIYIYIVIIMILYIYNNGQNGNNYINTEVINKAIIKNINEVDIDEEKNIIKIEVKDIQNNTTTDTLNSIIGEEKYKEKLINLNSGNLNSRFELGDNLEVQDFIVSSTGTNDLVNDAEYFVNNRIHDEIKKIGLESFLTEFYVGNINLIFPLSKKIPDIFHRQDIGIPLDLLKKYYDHGFKNIDYIYQYKYNIKMNLHSSKSGKSKIIYDPYILGNYDSFDGRKLDGDYVLPKKTIVDNITYPYFNKIELNNMDITNNLKLKGNTEKRYFSPKYFYDKYGVMIGKGNDILKVSIYKNKYVFEGNFKKGNNILDIEIYQYPRSSLGVIDNVGNIFFK